MNKEIPITRKNVHELKIGDTVKFHNGYEWDTAVLGEFELSRGYVMTGVHNEVSRFVNPMFKSMYLIKPKRDENGFYFVVFQGETTIARHINGSWTMCGNVNTYTDDDFETIDYFNPVYCL